MLWTDYVLSASAGWQLTVAVYTVSALWRFWRVSWRPLGWLLAMHALSLWWRWESFSHVWGTDLHGEEMVLHLVVPFVYPTAMLFFLLALVDLIEHYEHLKRPRLQELEAATKKLFGRPDRS